MAETTNNNKETNQQETLEQEVQQEENTNPAEAVEETEDAAEKNVETEETEDAAEENVEAEETEDAVEENEEASQESAWEKPVSNSKIPVAKPNAQPQKSVVAQGKVLLGCGMFVLGVAIGIGGTLFVEKKPWKSMGSSMPNRDYDVEKCVKLGDYKGIDVSLAASEEDIQSEIESLIEENTTYEQKKGTVKDGDKIYAKFDGYVDGKLMEDTSGEEYIDIGGDAYIEGFDTGFIGAQTGKEISFTVSIPDGTYGDDSIDGKDVTFKATVNYICGNAIKPEWNDDFVQSVSEFKTTDEYEADLKSTMEQENEDGKDDFAWTKVLENAEVLNYPEELMEAAKKEVLQGYYDMADMYGMSHDEIFQSWGMADEAEFVEKELDGLAQDTVKETLVAEAIAKAEGINYSDDEYNQTVSDEYEYNSDDYDSKDDYEKENREYLQSSTLQTKVQEWITERARFSK